MAAIRTNHSGRCARHAVLVCVGICMMLPFAWMVLASLKTLPDTYKRYLENFFRKRFKLVGTPVKFEFREGANPYEGKKNTLTEKQKKVKQRIIRIAKRAKK